ncbi:hypothetical protein NL526_27535, partial [Klebsiella pneumoniae]|nr:hypothetical protein [Klebsiella pneumoniae]
MFVKKVYVSNDYDEQGDLCQTDPPEQEYLGSEVSDGRYTQESLADVQFPLADPFAGGIVQTQPDGSYRQKGENGHRAGRLEL